MAHREQSAPVKALGDRPQPQLHVAARAALIHQGLRRRVAHAVVLNPGVLIEALGTDRHIQQAKNAGPLFMQLRSTALDGEWLVQDFG